ncbi:MAG: DUF1778 domain-containing protein [Planctomycetes bacterium]|nr:DUF1778 domain-containing protein [Planctomycetota bacterium]
MATMRMSCRLRPENKALIDQAARLLGMSVSEFANSRLVEIARQIIAEHNVTRLTDRDRDVFLTMLDADAEPNAALRKAFREVKSAWSVADEVKH